jgi:AcrR family transcriptional regulator
MPKVSEAHLEGRKDQIIEAATRCFAEGGFHATSMADVIEASSLSAGSVYRYFKSKDELIEAILDRLIEQVIGQLTQATGSTPLESIPASIQAAEQILSTPLGQMAQLLPQLWTEALRNEAVRQRAQTLYRTLQDHFGGIARQAQQAGHLPASVDAQGMAHVAVALIQGYLVQRLMLGEAIDTALYLRTVRQLLEQSPSNP